MSAEEWVVEGQYSVKIGWEILSYCESEEEANQLFNDYRNAEPRTPIRRRRLNNVD